MGKDLKLIKVQLKVYALHIFQSCPVDPIGVFDGLILAPGTYVLTPLI